MSGALNRGGGGRKHIIFPISSSSSSSSAHLSFSGAPCTSSILICPCLASPWWKLTLITGDTVVPLRATRGKTNSILVWSPSPRRKRLIHRVQIRPLPSVKSEGEGTRFMDWTPPPPPPTPSIPTTPLPHRLCVSAEP